MRGHYLLGAASALAIMAGISHSTPARAASGSTYMPAVGCTGYMYGNSISNPLNCVTQIPGAGLAPGAAATNLGFTPARVFNVTDPKYGAICNGNSSNAAVDTAGINAAVAAAAAAGGGVVALPPGNCYTNATITVAVSSVQIWGQGENSTTVTPTGAFDAFDFGYLANATNSHVGLRDLSIIWTSTPTSGYCFGVDHTYYAEVHNVFCQNSYAGVAIGPSYFGQYDNVRFLSSYASGSHGDGLYLYGDTNTIGSGTHPVSNNFNDWYFLSPIGGAFNHDVYIADAEHTNFKNLYLNGANTNDVWLSVQSTATATSPVIENTTFENIYVDNNSNMRCGFYLLGDVFGTIVDTKITDLIASGEPQLSGVGNYQGVCLDGSSPGSVADTKIVNANVFAWEGAGINIQNATDTQLTNVKVQNNNANNHLSSPGLDIGPGVQGLTATNLRAGGSTYGTSYQLYGVYLESGAQRVVIDGGDVTGNVSAGIQNVSGTTNESTISISNVVGYNGTMQHVASLVALSAYVPPSTANITVIRDDYAAGNGAPAMTYTWQTTCPGTPDNIALYVQPSGTSPACWSAASDPNVGNELEWGADKNGGVDSAAAFNAAETALSPLHIKRVIPPGTYLMSSSAWTISSSDEYQGMGQQVVALKGTTTTQNTVYISPGYAPHITDLTIDHTTASAPTAGAGLYSDDLAQPNLERLTAQNNWIGFRFGAVPGQAFGRKILSQNNYSHGITISDTNTNPSVQWQLTDVTSQLNNGWGIQFYLNSTSGSDTGANFSNVGTYKNTLGGTQYGGVSTSEMNDMTCNHCYGSYDGSDEFQFVQVGAHNLFVNTFAEYAGIAATGRGGATAASHTGTGVLFVSGASSPSNQNREVIFSTLSASQNSYAGVEVYSNSTLQNLLISNLTADGNGAYSNPAGLFLINTTTVTQVTGMHARDLGASVQSYGLSFGGVSAANSNTFISNAQLSGSTAGCATTLTNKSLVSGSGC